MRLIGSIDSEWIAENRRWISGTILLVLIIVVVAVFALWGSSGKPGNQPVVPSGPKLLPGQVLVEGRITDAYMVSYIVLDEETEMEMKTTGSLLVPAVPGIAKMQGGGNLRPPEGIWLKINNGPAIFVRNSVGVASGLIKQQTNDVLEINTSVRGRIVQMICTKKKPPASNAHDPARDSPYVVVSLRLFRLDEQKP